MKNRKLFPASTATNQTEDCPDFCGPSCPYDCPYPYFYFSPPPPPPPLLSGGHSRQLPPYAIVIATVLASFVLLIGYYVLVVKYCSGWNPFRAPASRADGRDENDYVDENQGPAIDHPIWYINTIGLQLSVIDSITVFKYKKSEPLIDGSDCSVCLTEFQDGETLRLLPKCNHAFHIPCIDTWLRSHTNCPLCRASILSNTSTATPSPPPPPPPASDDHNSSNSPPPEDSQARNLENNGESTNNEVSETQAGAEVQFSDASEVKDGVNTTTRNERQQLVRRSVSMDSSPAFSVNESEHGGTKLMEDDESNSYTVGSRQCASASARIITESTQKNSISMNRSFSFGGSLFASRTSRISTSVPTL